MTAGSELTPGTSVDRRYRIQCTLGRGGFGRTYLVADERRFGELCVLKEFVPNSQADPVVAQKLRELFQREAAILHQLDHPQIPKFFAGFEEDGRLFIAQEYIDGKTYWRLLQERQQQGEAFSPTEILLWLQSLLGVLDYLHHQNIVHRDISPDNIMLSSGLKLPVLIDFGVVKQVIPHLHVANTGDPDDLVQASVSVGKLGYAPNEQIRMGQCSPRSDLYALAVTAVVLLTGKPPNLLIDAKSLEWQWQSLVQLDPRLTEVLEVMMAEKPQDRYSSARMALQALQPLWQDWVPPRSSSLAPSAGAAGTGTAGTKATVVEVGSVETQLVLPQFALPAKQKKSAQKKANLGTEKLGEGNPAVTPDYPPNQSRDGQDGGEQVVEGTGSFEFQQIHLEPAVDAYVQDAYVQADSTEVKPLLALATVQSLSSDHLPAHLTLSALAASSLPPSQRLAALVTATSRLLLSRLIDLLQTNLLQPQRLPLPQDRLGNAKSLSAFSWRQMAMVGVLTLLPLSGAVVGIRSPHIASLCRILNNCAGTQTSAERYQQTVEQADSAKTLLDHARNLADLQQARQRLAESIAQLHTFASNTSVHTATAQMLSQYQALLQRLDQNLEQETRAAQLLNRAEAEAQKATEQTNVAKTLEQFQAAEVEWKRALATLEAIPDDTFIEAQATARRQEYTARLGAVTLKVGALTPASAAVPSPQGIAVTLPKPSPAVNSQPTARPTPIVAAPVTPPRTTPAASARQPVRQATSAPNRSSATNRRTPTRSATAPRSTPKATRSHHRPVPARPSTTAQQPNTSLDIASERVAGSVITSATQTLNNVSIWIEGTRTEADGEFVATLMIANRSGRGFSFVPLYAESTNRNKTVTRSRVLFTGTTDTTLEPGEYLSGQIYLLDRPAGSQRLTLVIEESTSGDRTFRIPF